MLTADTDGDGDKGLLLTRIGDRASKGVLPRLQRATCQPGERHATAESVSRREDDAVGSSSGFASTVRMATRTVKIAPSAALRPSDRSDRRSDPGEAQWLRLVPTGLRPASTRPYPCASYGGLGPVRGLRAGARPPPCRSSLPVAPARREGSVPNLVGREHGVDPSRRHLMPSSPWIKSDLAVPL